MSDNDSLGMELTKRLFELEPELLDNDPEATGRAIAALSNLLGCVLAIVFVEAGSQSYLETIQFVMNTAHQAAADVIKKSNEQPPMSRQ